FVQRHEIGAPTVRGNRGVDLLVEHHEGHRGQGTVDSEGQNILRYTGVDLFGRGAVGIDEHQTPTTFVRELETTPAQTIHAGGGHNNGDLTVASYRGVTRGQVQLGEVEIVGVARSARPGHFHPQRQGLTRSFVVEGVHDDVARFIGQR